VIVAKQRKGRVNKLRTNWLVKEFFAKNQPDFLQSGPKPSLYYYP